jgi:hypothetical protein
MLPMLSPALNRPERGGRTRSRHGGTPENQ